jgi:hypothetical protein
MNGKINMESTIVGPAHALTGELIMEDMLFERPDEIIFFMF